jgi:hypothetical protein
MTLMVRDLARCIDPSMWLRDAGHEPDPWQQRALRSRSKRKLWNIHRQGGKSTTAGALALAKATTEPGSLSLLISPSQRQSAELLRSVLMLHSQIPDLPAPIAESAHRLEFGHGGRVISLPSSEGTVRGYSKVALLVLDEASRIPEEIIAAVRPMLAISDGEIVALSTPFGRRGFFYEAFEHGDAWERERVPVTECPRISKTFLAEERKALGELLFRQEYLCEFVDNDEQIFSGALIERALTDEVRPLWL